jgi:DNA recombination protein RmuC
MDVTTIVTILGIAILGAIGYLIFRLQSLAKPQDQQSNKLMLDVVENLRKSIQESEGQNRKELQQKLDGITKLLGDQQYKSMKTMQDQFGQSMKIMGEVTQELTKVKETNKQVVGFAEQMKSLENILKNPKQRGILGEYFLETLLGNVLPPNQYQMQYGFKDGEIVDAAIFVGEHIIPVDAKFSLEKYNLIMNETDKDKREELEKEFKEDIKKRIDETSKYIRPVENTTDFAFMFIPAEGIFYNLLAYEVGAVKVNTQNIIEYAFKKHVLIVSPTSFFAYLQTVLHGLNALKMEKSIMEIVKRVNELGRHLQSYDQFMMKLGSNLGTTVGAYNTAYKELKKIDKDVVRISDGEEGGKIEPILLEKPAQE